MKKIQKTGLFIDKAPDREAPPVEVAPPVEGEVPVVAEGEAVPVVPELIPGEWFWTLKARNGNVIAGRGLGSFFIGFRYQLPFNYGPLFYNLLLMLMKFFCDLIPL